MHLQDTTELCQCKKCGQSKTRKEFSRNSKTVDGIARVCKSCYANGSVSSLLAGLKFCIQCKKIKPITEFRMRVSTYGQDTKYSPRCKACANHRDDPTEKEKECSNCLKIKPLDQFYKSKRYRMGVSGICISCKVIYGKERSRETSNSNREIPTEKSCGKCGKTKKSSEFSIRRGAKSGLKSYCKECINSLPREVNKERALWLHRKRIYGITKEQFDELLYRQGHACGLCKEPLHIKDTYVDHCHKTNVVRGILCVRCNNQLSPIERPGFLEAALAYLERTKNGVI